MSILWDSKSWPTGEACEGTFCVCTRSSGARVGKRTLINVWAGEKGKQEQTLLAFLFGNVIIWTNRRVIWVGGMCGCNLHDNAVSAGNRCLCCGPEWGCVEGNAGVSVTERRTHLHRAPRRTTPRSPGGRSCRCTSPPSSDRCRWHKPTGTGTHRRLRGQTRNHAHTHTHAHTHNHPHTNTTIIKNILVATHLCPRAWLCVVLYYPRRTRFTFTPLLVFGHLVAGPTVGTDVGPLCVATHPSQTQVALGTLVQI